MKIESFINNRFFIYTILAITCVIILLQSSLAPGSISIIGNDSSNFITITQNVLNGDILFKDIADHKGPMVFFMDAIGIKLAGGNLIGIWFLEILSLFITSIFSFKTVCLLSSRIIALIATILSLIFIVPILLSGNLTEEWTLPYISIALYVFTKYLIGKTKALSVFHLFILSFTFIIAFLFKASYIGLWCAFGFIIIIKLIIEKKLQELCKYLIYILVFSSITLLPFILYFYFNDALTDAYFGSIGFNMQYSYAESFISVIVRMVLIIIGVWHLPIVVILSIAFSIYNKEYHKYPYLFYGFILAIVLTTYSCAIGMKLEHYNIIFAPLLVLPYTYLAHCMKLKSFTQQFALLLLISGSGYIFFIKQLDSRNYNSIFGEAKIKFQKIANTIQKHTLPTDTIIGTNEVERVIYIYANRKCGNKSLGNNYHYDIPDEILAKRPKLFFSSLNNDFEKLQPYYQLTETIDNYQIWIRKE